MPYGHMSYGSASHLGMYLTGVYLINIYLIVVYQRVSHRRVPHRRVPHGRLPHRRVPHRRVPHLRAFLAHRTRVTRISISTPRMFLRLLNCGRLGRQAAGHPWSALRVVKSYRKDCPTAEVLLEAKAAALHPKWYQSFLSKLSTREMGEAGKRSAGNQVIDRQVEGRQTGRNKADERWYPSRPCSVLSSGLQDTTMMTETHMRQRRKA
jgi:hypothetical protein